ncbi:MAG: sugar phosphate isomerase [Planctomycetaceae bacterium]|nr:MAG: sugar phosphate isomerase [Planctomycetaceae bacterium]
MRVRTDGQVDLTYCLNVHPGETWDENFAAIREKATAVRGLVAPGQAFGLGLRLSATAAVELIKPKRLKEFQDFLAAENLYVFTINGFPFGQFHNTAVKADVYAPDWRTKERLQYTILLAEILAELLPVGGVGSISTVPLSYKSWIKSDDDVAAMVRQLAETAAHLHMLTVGERYVTLALEPEPDCFIENTDELLAFFERWTPTAVRYIMSELGLSEAICTEIWRQHIGVCFDTAHAAVAFEDMVTSLERIRRAGVAIGKVQLSSALAVKPTPDALCRLAEFVDNVYLHQVKALGRDGKVTSFADLPDVLNAANIEHFQELRVHYHVPLFFQGEGDFRSTSDLLIGPFARFLQSGITPHVEIETYTFTVLPASLRPADLSEGIAEEFRWVMGNVFSSQ